MVAVIVDKSDAVDDAFHVEAAADSGEICETFANQVRRHGEIKGDGGSGGGIADIVHSRGRGEMEHAEVVSAIGETEITLQTAVDDIRDNEIGLSAGTVRNYRARDVR